MYRIGVIGDYDSICGFAALGLDIYPVDGEDDAREVLKRLANMQYGIIYITEPLMEQINDECNRYSNKITPSIIPIPACTGVTGFGKEAVKAYVEQAVGSDIIFND